MSKIETIKENWSEIITKLMQDKQEFAQFLRFSAGMYKQSFSDAALIYHQNPNATKVATLETWNKLGRLVNKGEHSIAVFGEDSRAKHLFDITQTNGKRIPELWKLTEDLSAELTAAINKKYGKGCKDIQETIAAMSVDNIRSHLSEMMYATGQMKLADNDLKAYQQSVVSAVRFMVSTRCELGSDMKISGGINLNAADFFKEKRDLVRFCAIVQKSAKDTLLEMEREIVQIIRKRREKSDELQTKPDRAVSSRTGVHGGHQRTETPAKANRQVGQNVAGVGENRVPNRGADLHNGGSVADNSENNRQGGGEPLSGTGRAVPSGKSPSADVRGNSVVGENAASDDRTSDYGGNNLSVEELIERYKNADFNRRLDSYEIAGRMLWEADYNEFKGGAVAFFERFEADKFSETQANEICAIIKSALENREKSHDFIDVSVPDESDEPSQNEPVILNNEIVEISKLPPFLNEKYIAEILTNDRFFKIKRDKIAEFFENTPDIEKRAEFMKKVFNSDYTELDFDDTRLGYKADKSGVLMWEGNFLSRTSEAVFSWDLVQSLTAELIEKGEYFDKKTPDEPVFAEPEAKEFPEPEPVSQVEQLSFFGENNEPTEPVKKVSQRPIAFSRNAPDDEMIDYILKCGSNEPKSLERIVAQFQKEKSAAENAEFLRKEFGEDGRGYNFVSRDYTHSSLLAAWFDNSGITAAISNTAFPQGEKIHLSWEQVPEKISALLDKGEYCSQDIIDRAAEIEMTDIAGKLWYIHQDLSGDYDKEYFIPKDFFAGGFPDSTERIKISMTDENTLQKYIDGLSDFIGQYEENRNIMRYHFHNLKETLQRLNDLKIPRKEFIANADFKFEPKFFITEDEKDRLLTTGSGVVGGKFRIEKFFKAEHTAKEKADFIKNEYGIGGTGHSGFSTWHDSKGLHFRKDALSKGEAVYLLYPDNTEGLAENRSDIENFDGYFGTEKEPSDFVMEQNNQLIPVSKEVALDMYDKELDVFIDGKIAENRSEIENVPDDKKLYLSEYQYAAQLDFENPKITNTAPIPEKNIIGNTPYRELGDKSELQYYKNLKNRHAENIAAQLNADGIRFSGLKKEWTTTITINKADIPAYEAAVEKVKVVYDKAKNAAKNTAEIPNNYSQNNNYEKPAKPAQESTSSNSDKDKTDIGNTPYEEMGDKSELQIYRNLKSRHAENIAAQLNADGVKFSGVKMGTVAAIAVKKSDVSKYEAAVEKVKAGYKKTEVPSAKPLSVTAEIDKAISDNNYELYHYDLEKAAYTVIEKCGIERTSKILADYINSRGYDGRISSQNKAWAKNFEPPKDRYGPVFKTHPTVLDGFIDSFRDRIKSLEIKSMPPLYEDKFLYSSERVELRDDYRGIPETNYYMSSANEYFVEGIGWLDDTAYDREQKMSGLSAQDFYAKVTHINADYVDISGSVGQIDLSKSDYNLLTEKTYSPENAEKLKAAKAALQERKTAAGITEKPVEYYAVRQTNDHKFAVCTISADGLVTPVKPNLGTVAEAKKAMLELFEKKKNSVKCEFIHPQNLDEKSAELYKNMPRETPDVTYRIQVNPRKNAAEDNTHYLQEYIKNPDDTYKVGEVICKGDFEKCNSALADILKNGIERSQEKNISKPDFEIYQLKKSDENIYIRFESLERLAELGQKPDFSNYDKIYEGDMSAVNARGDTVGDKLEAVFVKFNLDRPEDFKGHSLSVSDVVVMDDKAYYVDSVGFQPLKEFKPIEKNIEKEKAEDVPEQEKQKPPKKPKL